MQTNCNWDSIFLWAHLLLIIIKGKTFRMPFSIVSNIWMIDRLVGPHISNYTPLQGDRVNLVDQEDNGGTSRLVCLSNLNFGSPGMWNLLSNFLPGSFMTNAIVHNVFKGKSFLFPLWVDFYGFWKTIHHHSRSLNSNSCTFVEVGQSLSRAWKSHLNCIFYCVWRWHTSPTCHPLANESTSLLAVFFHLWAQTATDWTPATVD